MNLHWRLIKAPFHLVIVFLVMSFLAIVGLNLLENFMFLLLFKHLVPEPLHGVLGGVWIFVFLFVEKLHLLLDRKITTLVNKVQSLKYLHENSLSAIVDIPELWLSSTRLQLEYKLCLLNIVLIFALNTLSIG